ncbi:phage integrase family protein [Pseudonocardia sp. Ae717_Ps2]|nr:phage integrase family protein [Pseudonocardia sp. Ae717_Ps2]
MTMSWIEFARCYADMKWGDSAPKSRKSTADNLIAISRVVFKGRRGEPERSLMGAALRVSFNSTMRQQVIPEGIEGVIRWMERSSPSVAEIMKPAKLRQILSDIERTAAGDRCAKNTIRLRRTTLRNAMDYAVERGLLATNPIGDMKIKRNKVSLREVDQRSVVNPVQARTLLRAVKEDSPRLHAFFAAMYYAALRPEEVINLRAQNLTLPSDGWGEIALTRAAPEVAAEWTDHGTVGEERELKHRGVGEGRIVPCSPALVELLRAHIARYGTTADGRLFRAMRSEAPLSSSVYGRAWERARTATFTEQVLTSPLALRPYDLRHAAVSTWLNATGDPTRVAEWAGHTVSVLLRVYAKCLDGGEIEARRRVAERLDGG